MIIQTFTLAAGAAKMIQIPGLVLSVKTCSLALTASFDGGNTFSLTSGGVYDRRPGGFRYLNLVNNNSADATVSLFIGDAPVNFAPPDSSASAAASNLVGNLGIANSTAANGNDPQCDANGNLILAAGGVNYTLAGTNADGLRRQMIIFSVAAASPSSLLVKDTNGNSFAIIAAGSPPFALPTDSDVEISSANPGATALVVIGELWLKNK